MSAAVMMTLALVLQIGSIAAWLYAARGMQGTIARQHRIDEQKETMLDLQRQIIDAKDATIVELLREKHLPRAPHSAGAPHE